MDSGKMGNWVVGDVPFDMEANNVHNCLNPSLKDKTSIPIFHYSIIPGLRQKQQASTIPLTLETYK
jgi:hypothetical protein